MKDELYFPEDNDRSEKLFHYGTPQRFAGDPHGSGRYRLGSGEDPYQNKSAFIQFVNEYRNAINPETGKKYTETQIANAWGISTTKYRSALRNIATEQKAAAISRCVKLRSQGLRPSEIARETGLPESTVRKYLQPDAEKKATAAVNVRNYLKEQVDEKKYLDVGNGVEAQLGISKEQLKTSVEMLCQLGYKKQYLAVPQATNPKQKTTIEVLTKDDVDWNEVNENRDLIRSPHGKWFEDDGYTMRNIKDPVSVSSDRIAIRYGNEGGAAKDGVIELRPGVEDISLGQNHYAQVRIAVDGTHYLKGMAVYSNDLPPGVDILFNTNKDSSVPKMKVLKTMETDDTGGIDKENPFGSTIRQYDYIGKDGKPHQSAINIVNDDTDWEKWSKTLSSQFLSKQTPALAKRQLDLVYKEKADLFSDAKKVGNSTVKEYLLENLADECDSAAVSLKAAALPRQESKVLLPLTTIKDNEVYAPTYRQGEEVVLIRHPHGGRFEIPRLTVNNKLPEGKAVVGNAEKAIGISAKVAEQLSGADFDGDTVIVIPTKNQNIITSKPLKELKGFDPKIQYKAYEGMPKVTKQNFAKQSEMGKISNLITDMTIKGAPESEIARAVKHSMVIIDAEKHNLNYKQSAIDNQIAQLKEKYQGGKNSGASTVVSRAKSQTSVDMREARYDIDPKTGEKIYRTPRSAYWTDPKTGEVRVRREISTKMAEAKDAFDLVSRDKSGATTRIETVYANHANKMKALGNEIRKELYKTQHERDKVNKSAKEMYKKEVASLEAKARQSTLNAPNERLAQAAASKKIEAMKKANPGMEKDEIKKRSSQIIAATRRKAGAMTHDEKTVRITDREWEAIMSGAIAQNKLRTILQRTENGEVARRAVPRASTAVPQAKVSRARALLNAGYTWAEAAEAIGVSEATLRKNMKG